MKVVMTIHFRMGDIRWFNSNTNHWGTIDQEDIFKTLRGVVDVFEFDCVNNTETREFTVKATVAPLSVKALMEGLKEGFEKRYKKREVDIRLEGMKLEKGEVVTYTAAIVMEKIENG